MKLLYSMMISAGFFAACQSAQETKQDNKKDSLAAKAKQEWQARFVGDFVSEGYADRQKGADWYAVMIDPLNDSMYQVSIRSRADRKKPSCTFDAKALVKDANHLVAAIDSLEIVFSFTDSSLTISAAKGLPEQLQYFCSGGASIAGTYQRLQDNLDTEKMDPRKFIKALHFGNHHFFVETKGEGSLQDLTMQVIGLEQPTKIEQPIEGSISDAVVMDMDNDQLPELLLFLQSPGSGSYGSIMAYTVTKQNKLEKVMVPSIEQDAVLGKQYMGHDRYETAKGRFLVHYFPMYQNGDANCCPTGGTKMIQYSLEQARAAKRLRIDFVSNLPQQ
jgi:hypothetical protein